MAKGRPRRMAALKAYAQLIRWLQPGAPSDKAPTTVDRRSFTFQSQPVSGALEGPDAGRPIEAWLYTPTDRPAAGAFLVAPGLHFLGPKDPRLDRFLRVLSSAGLVVCVPFIPDYMSLKMAPRAIRDFECAFEAFLEQPEIPSDSRPGLFSISFGSLLALRLASSEKYRGRVGGVITYGGYADWHGAIRFCLTGRISETESIERDPLNQPVIFMSTIDRIDGAPSDTSALQGAWLQYVEATWDNPDMKARELHEPIALEIAATLSETDRRWFLIGCGIEPGGYELIESTQMRGQDAWDFLNPLPHLDGVTCPIHLFHGCDDDVIPYTQLFELAEAMPDHVRVRTYLTGLYGHTGTTALWGSFRRIPTMLKEIWTMGRMVRAIMSAASG